MPRITEVNDFESVSVKSVHQLWNNESLNLRENALFCFLELGDNVSLCAILFAATVLIGFIVRSLGGIMSENYEKSNKVSFAI